MSVGWRAGMSLDAARLFSHYARYERQSGTQTLSVGDNLVSFPTEVEPDELVTPHGSGNIYWTLGSGLWLCLSGVRTDGNTDMGLYWSKGAVVSEVNSFGTGGCANFVVGGAVGIIAVPDGTTQDVNLTMFSSNAVDVVAYGDGMTHVAFARLNPAS